jgi:hypothetical protein
MKTIETEEPDLIFVQEPYEYQNRPVGMVKNTKYSLLEMGNLEQPLLSQIKK